MGNELYTQTEREIIHAAQIAPSVDFDLRLFTNWRHMIYGAYNIHDIIQAVQNDQWQRIRTLMRGQSLETKFQILTHYTQRNKSGQGGVPHNIKVQVTNYVFALKRGGLIK